MIRSNSLTRLLQSLKKLEDSISLARGMVGNIEGERANHHSMSHDVILRRLDSYQEILVKQRYFAKDLCDHMKMRDWYQVSRHIRIINGLSQMIRDDARELISHASLRKKAFNQLELQ